MMTMRWHQAPYREGGESAVPSRPGLYVVCEVRRLLALPVETHVRFVGRSDDLRRSWREHLAPNEPNPLLLNLQRSPELEFWWAEAPARDLRTMEAELVERLRPPANRLRARSHMPLPPPRRRDPRASNQGEDR